MRVERLVYRGLRQAIAVATTKEEERQAHLRESFRDILRKQRIRSVYQPIFQLERLDLFGHEALTRGPADTAFESPELLFQFAAENEAVWELEQLCLTSSASRYPADGGGLLFINVEAETVTALSRSGPEAVPALFAQKHPIVLEVTERSAIRDVAVFRNALKTLRQLGFRIAIDEIGRASCRERVL